MIKKRKYKEKKIKLINVKQMQDKNMNQTYLNQKMKKNNQNLVLIQWRETNPRKLKNRQKKMMKNKKKLMI